MTRSWSPVSRSQSPFPSANIWLDMRHVQCAFFIHITKAHGSFCVKRHWKKNTLCTDQGHSMCREKAITPSYTKQRGFPNWSWGKKNNFQSIWILFSFPLITYYYYYSLLLWKVLKYSNTFLRHVKGDRFMHRCTFFTYGNSAQASISSRTLAWLNEKAVNSLGSPHGKAALAPQQLISSLHPLLWEQLNNWHQRVWPEMHAWTYLKPILDFKAVCINLRMNEWINQWCPSSLGLEVLKSKQAEQIFAFSSLW